MVTHTGDGHAQCCLACFSDYHGCTIVAVLAGKMFVRGKILLEIFKVPMLKIFLSPVTDCGVNVPCSEFF